MQAYHALFSYLEFFRLFDDLMHMSSALEEKSSTRVSNTKKGEDDDEDVETVNFEFCFH